MNLGSTSKSWDRCKAAKKLNEDLGLGEHDLWYDIGAFHEARTDSAVILLKFFVMACILRPAVVLGAHQEPDRVVGMRMPIFDDTPNLPYIKAIVKEVFHWKHPSLWPTPCVSEDDIYRGFWISKGTAVVANHFALDTDEAILERPHCFDTDIWIRNSPVSALGFG